MQSLIKGLFLLFGTLPAMRLR